MSEAVLSENPETSFNSKRCDYENTNEGQVNAEVFSFNSKRCDYEYLLACFFICSYSVSIPKGAIMSGANGNLLSSSNTFQFQKVRL